jgi:PhnB protein
LSHRPHFVRHIETTNLKDPMKLNTYLTFNGNCEEALKFYEKTLGGKTVFMMRYGESPEAHQCSKEMQSKIMHGRIVIVDNVLMGSDGPPERFNGNHGFGINISVNSIEEAERLFKGLSEKAKDICMPMGETFWAERFGMLTDQFGVPWMVNFEKKQ